MTKLEQTDIFSMFDIEDEAAIKLEAAKVAALKVQQGRKERMDKLKEAGNDSQTKTPASTPKKDPFKVLADTIIRYGGMEFPVTNYFTVEEIVNGLPNKKKKSDNSEDEESEESMFRPISENDLRKKLEDDFPELVANFTTLVFLEKKNIVVPILQAKKKGLTDDCMETSTNVGVSVSTKRKIPFHFLADFIVIAKEFSEKYGSEVHADLYFDLDKNVFFMDFPKQLVSRYQFINQESAEKTVMKFIDRRYKKLMEIHSHHIMPATPSSIDDMNERAPILYAIVGRIDHLFPEITVRTFDKDTQSHIPLNPASIFENPMFQEYATYLYDTSVVEVE